MNSKYIYILIFLANSVFSQSAAEREQILKSSDPAQVALLKKTYFDYSENQKKLIREYLSKPGNENLNPFSLQRIIDGVPVFYGEDNNANSVSSIRGNALYPGGSLGLNVTGLGMTGAVWDGGMVRNTHLEFSGRVLLSDSSTSLSQHATHVTGTVIAQGVTNLSRRGFAYQASAKTYDWTSDVTEMIDHAGAGFLVSNHSYGNIAANLPTYSFGSYSSQSIELDDIMYTFPYYQVIKSAGNDRDNTSLAQVTANQGYDLLSGWCNSKNVITVAATTNVQNYTTPFDVEITDFSNFGPPDDGRVKPDISANGFDITSCNSVSNTAFISLSGTSMASPAITGLILLLQKHYNNLNATQYMKSATTRAVLFHTTREAGANLGPDYQFGWGLADGYEAARLITAKGSTAIIDERTLANAGSYTIPITITSAQDIRVTIAWTDPPGNSNGTAVDNRTPRLKNNLDLKLIKDGTTYYPWLLDPTNPTAGATNVADNNVDNTERVEIINAQPGTYTVQVTHKGTLVNSSQDYTLIASSTTGLNLNNADFIADNNFFVYPNPAKDVINFSNPNNFEVKEISITDISGKVVVFNKSITSDSVDISRLQSGVYFIKFTSEGFSTVKKFIKD